MAKWLVLAALVLIAWTLVAQTGKQKNLLPPKTFLEQWRAAKHGVLLDVRTPKEFGEAHLAGSLNLNFFDEDFQKRIKGLSKDQTYFVYCRSGGRSGKTAKLMARSGFRVYDMAGGILAWKKDGLPVKAKSP